MQFWVQKNFTLQGGGGEIFFGLFFSNVFRVFDHLRRSEKKNSGECFVNSDHEISKKRKMRKKSPAKLEIEPREMSEKGFFSPKFRCHCEIHGMRCSTSFSRVLGAFSEFFAPFEISEAGKRICGSRILRLRL